MSGLIPSPLSTFTKNSNGERAQRIIGSGGIVDGIVYDEIIATYPSTTREVYMYRLSGSEVAIVTVNYTDSTKDLVEDVKRT